MKDVIKRMGDGYWKELIEKELRYKRILHISFITLTVVIFAISYFLPLVSTSLLIIVIVYPIMIKDVNDNINYHLNLINKFNKSK